MEPELRTGGCIPCRNALRPEQWSWSLVEGAGILWTNRAATAIIRDNADPLGRCEQGAGVMRNGAARLATTSQAFEKAH